MTARANPTSLADAPWLTAAATQRVLGAIADGGFTARCVGGVVRNALMGLPVTDIDIATTAPPADVIRLARAARLNVVETGLQHGTVTVIVDKHPFEVTTLRRDVETDGRHATVAFTDDWAEDARRRDFTINALYCDAAGVVYDPLGGYPDLLANRVRFIGESADRIREDYLRILRFFRFTAQYSQAPPDAAGLAASTRLRAGMRKLSRERIHQELTRLLIAPGAISAIETMQSHGILAEVLAAAPRPRQLARLIGIEARHRLKPDAMLRLAALAVETPEDGSRIADALRLSREERSVLELCSVYSARLDKAPTERIARALLYRRGPADYRRVIALSWARAFSSTIGDAAWTQALALPERWSAPKLPVSGADLIAAGIPPGPSMGSLLRALDAWWMEQDFGPGQTELLAWLKTQDRSHDGT